MRRKSRPRRLSVCAPPHRIWPIIAEHAEPGDLLPPRYTHGDFNRSLKFIQTTLKFADAQNFTSKAFRRGATQEILQAGNNLETLKGSGGWAGSGFLPYVDTEIASAFKAQKMIIALSDGSSSEDENP